MKKTDDRKKLLFILLILSLPFFLFQGCSKKQKEDENKTYKLNIAVENSKNKAGKTHPVSVTLVIDEKEILKNKMVDGSMPLAIAKDLTKGNHSIRVTELTTGAVYKSFLTMDKDQWLRVVFVSEGKGMGEFQAKIQSEPWGYEFEKSKENKETNLNEQKNREDDFDKKLNELSAEKKKQEKEKKQKEKNAGKSKSGK